MILANSINENSSDEDDDLEVIDFIRSRSRTIITWEHLWTFDLTRNALLNSPFFVIPNEILLKIFELLSVRDLGNVSLVCRLFKMIVGQDYIWKIKCNSKLLLFY